MLAGTTWQVIVNLRPGQRGHDRRRQAGRGRDRLVGHVDAVVEGANPNCMMLWMDWITSPWANAQVAEWFGEAPANRESCALTANPDHCEIFHADETEYWERRLVLDDGHRGRASTAAPTSRACPTPSGSTPGTSCARSRGDDVDRRRPLGGRAPRSRRRTAARRGQPAVPPAAPARRQLRCSGRRSPGCSSSTSRRSCCSSSAPCFTIDGFTGKPTDELHDRQRPAGVHDALVPRRRRAQRAVSPWRSRRCAS